MIGGQDSYKKMGGRSGVGVKLAGGRQLDSGGLPVAGGGMNKRCGCVRDSGLGGAGWLERYHAPVAPHVLSLVLAVRGVQVDRVGHVSRPSWSKNMADGFGASRNR